METMCRNTPTLLTEAHRRGIPLRRVLVPRATSCPVASRVPLFRRANALPRFFSLSIPQVPFSPTLHADASDHADNMADALVQKEFRDSPRNSGTRPRLTIPRPISIFGVKCTRPVLRTRSVRQIFSRFALSLLSARCCNESSVLNFLTGSVYIV